MVSNVSKDIRVAGVYTPYAIRNIANISGILPNIYLFLFSASFLWKGKSFVINEPFSEKPEKVYRKR